MKAIAGPMLAVTLLLLSGCGGSQIFPSAAAPEVVSPEVVAPEVVAPPAAPDLSTNAAVCTFVSATPRHQTDTTLLWAQVNAGSALQEVLAIGWQPGAFNSPVDGELLKAEQFYKTLPVAREVVTLRPGVDVVSVAFTGTNVGLAYNTTFLLPASVVSGYVDTPEGRNAVQATVQVIEELPPSSGPNGLELRNPEGNLVAQC